MPPWGWVEELLAQVIEEVSVLAAERRRKEPRTVKRPYQTSPSQPEGGLVRHQSGGMVAIGHDAMLAMFAGRVKAAPPSPSVEVPGG